MDWGLDSNPEADATPRPVLPRATDGADGSGWRGSVGAVGVVSGRGRFETGPYGVGGLGGMLVLRISAWPRMARMGLAGLQETVTGRGRVQTCPYPATNHQPPQLSNATDHADES